MSGGWVFNCDECGKQVDAVLKPTIFLCDECLPGLHGSYSGKIEEMDDAALAKKISDSYRYEHKNKYRPIPYVGDVPVEVSYVTEELVSVCPATGYPDFYRLEILFVPRTVLPELKALKMHLMEYRDLPISHEHLCAKILSDFWKNVGPERCKVILKATPRGGIHTTVTASK